MVIEQVDRGARVAAAMPPEAAEDPWLARNPALLEASLAAAQAFDIPLWAVLAVSIDAISRPTQQVDLFNRLARGEPAGWR